MRIIITMSNLIHRWLREQEVRILRRMRKQRRRGSQMRLSFEVREFGESVENHIICIRKRHRYCTRHVIDT